MTNLRANMPIPTSTLGNPPAHRNLRFTQRAQNTRSNQRQDLSGAPIVRRPADWRTWPEVSIYLQNVASDATTLSLFMAFDREGTLTLIDIFEGNDGVRTKKAKIKFSPPPKTDFWNRDKGRYTLTNEHGAGYIVQLRLDRPLDPARLFQSPFRKHMFYPPLMKFAPHELIFGIMEDEQTIMSCRRIQHSQQDPISFIIDLRRRRLTVQFNVSFIDPRHTGVEGFKSEIAIGQNDRVNTYMFQIPFEQLRSFKRLDYEQYDIRDYFGLVVSLESPPPFYRKQIGSSAGHVPGNLTWSEFDTWYRQTDVDYDPYRLNTVKMSLHKENPEIDTGRWTTYMFNFKKSNTDMNLYKQMEEALSDFNVSIEDTKNDVNWEPRPAEVWNLIDPQSAYDITAELQSLDPEEMSLSLPFEVRYQLEVCISRGFINDYNISREFIQQLVKLSLKDSIKARYLLEYVAEQGKRVFEPMTIFTNEEALAYSSRTDIPHYCAYVRKATVTPSTIYFSTPTVETTNRVLRRYERENRDGRFLRVQFTDELFEGKINSAFKKTRNDELYTRVYRTLYNGIRIGDRHYELLAFGNSQFRENGAYFFCKTDEISCDDIRAWMGNFSKIDVVAKYAARLGQCFSTTRAINGLSNPQLIKISDIKRNGYTFTDGVGKISPFMAQMIATELGLLGPVPSAFQFRLGGCKGIVVVWPDAKEKEVHIRPSQEKFPATYRGLEIVRCSQFSCASLNRQTITILSALGVPDEVFLAMLTEQLKSYESAMQDDDLAVSLLCRYIDDSQMTINIATMIRNDFGPNKQKDPFVISLLHLWRAWSIRLLKEKAKIIVEEGAFVLGCTDETATLKGYTTPVPARGEKHSIEELPEIFIQVPDKADPNNYRVIEGICLVGRNPSLHPGDLRVVRAVNVPALHHIRNVVVFSQNGDRDVPSMCSGGDLDGDDFFVLWDKNLRPERWNCEPMDYTAPVPKSKKTVKMTDLMKFFVVFMKNDSLPTIAHAHLAQADYLEGSVDDPKCLELAQLHSKAVDYVKSGQPAEMPKYLVPRKWPHFMEKRHQPKEKQYVSEKILGQLYDRVETVSFVPQWQHRFDPRILRAYPLEDAMLKTVRQVKSQYDTAMRRILANQEIGSEFEVWSTFVLSKPRAGNDYKYQEEVARLSAALKDQFRAVCIEKAGGKEFPILAPFVAGMYKVTKEELDIALAECRATKMVAGRSVPKRKMEPKSMPLISFPWLFEKELGRIATGMDATVAMEELGLLPLGYKPDGTSKKKQKSYIEDFDDFVEQEEGVIVHRGEKLDLFRSDLVDLSEEEYTDEEAIRNRRLLSIDELGINDSDSDFQNDGQVRTGVEDIVTPAILQGLIGSEEAARWLHESSSLLPPAVLSARSDHLPTHDASLGTILNASKDSGSHDSAASDLQSLDEVSLEHETFVTSVDGHPFDSVERTMIPAEEAGLFEAEDMSDDEGEAEEIPTLQHGEGLAEVDENLEEEEEEEVEEEHIEEIVVHESAMEKLARIQRA